MPRHREQPRRERIGWLRAAVLGVNDGVVSRRAWCRGWRRPTGAARRCSSPEVAGLVAGAMSTAAGEYVSVNSPADTEQADLARELRAHDALAAPARSESGIVDALGARPVRPALTSALSFAVSAALPLVVALPFPDSRLVPVVAGASLPCPGVLGGLAAGAGGTRPWRGEIQIISAEVKPAAGSSPG